MHPSLMGEWRKLRKEQPDLFSQLRVWQQPAAVVDQIIWRWQCELEAAEYSQAVRCTDTLSAAWSKQSKEITWLLQQMGCPVPEGCTPLCQPTDTHLAKPAKDAGRQEKDRLRELMRLCCLQLGQTVRYVSGKKEMVQIALAMQAAMQELNSKTEVVFQAARAGGWLAYRPDSQGNLARADRQVWAQIHLETGGRVSAAQLQPRYNWLDQTGKPVRQDNTDFSAEQHQHLPPVQPEAEDLELEDWQPDHLNQEEKALAQAVQTHPALRPDDALAAQVAGLTMHQKAKLALKQGQSIKGPTRSRARLLRKNLAKTFQAALSEAGGSVSKRLSQIHPSVTGKTGNSAKNQRRQAKKDKKKKSLKVLTAAKKAGKSLKKLAKRSKQLAWQKLSGEAASSLGNDSGPLKGKFVRLVAPGLLCVLRNSTAIVLSH